MGFLANSTWWNPKLAGRGSASPPHTRLIPLVKSMQRAQSQRYLNMRRMIAVYEYGYNSSADVDNSTMPINDTVAFFNPAKNAIDTMHAQVCTPRIAPMIMTEGGTKAQRDRAKMSTKALEGVLDENDFEQIQEDVILDGMLAYCGFVQVRSCIEVEGTDRIGELIVERVSPEDIFVDDAEGRDRAPRCIYRRRRMDRYVVLAEYGGADAELYGSRAQRSIAITKAPSERTTTEAYGAQETDQIEVWEAWHLPSGDVDEDDDGAARHDGLHVICIEGCTLLAEPWGRESFPIHEYRPEKARSGFWGLAVMRQAMAGQREYESVTAKLQRAHKGMGSSMFIASRDAKINAREIGNGQAMVIECDGSPDSLKPLTPAPANPQTYAYRDSLASDMLRFMGMSEFGAQSEVPAGFTNASGKALNALEDTESKRGIIRHRSRERLVTGVAKLILEEARALLKAGVRVESRYRDKGSFQPIDWKEIVDVLDDKKSFVVKVLPVGALDKSPAAKFAQLDNWLERQIITVDQYKRMADLPDLEAETDVDTADTDIIDRNLDHMATKGLYLAPQPFDNLALCVSRGGKYYNAMRLANLPDARLELIRRYITDAQMMTMPAPPPPGEPMVPPPAAAPMATPVDPSMGDPMPPGIPPSAPPIAA